MSNLLPSARPVATFRAMTKHVVVMALALVIGLGRVAADGVDDLYLRIYSTIQEADALSARNETAPALAKYIEAQADLQAFQQGNPQWNPKVVTFRMDYLSGKISDLSAKVPPVTSATAALLNAIKTNLPAADAAPLEAQRPAAPADWLEQLNNLKAQAGQLQSDKAGLEAKLKEALSLRPASLEPSELAKAEAKLKALQKENDLLKVSLEEKKSKPVPAADPKELAKAQESLKEAQQQLGAQTDLVARLQTENAKLRRDKAELEASVKAAASAPPVAVPAPVVAESPRVKESKRIKQLEQERDDYKEKWKLADKALKSRKDKMAATRVQELEDEVSRLRARVESFEAKQIPFTAEELALFRQPEAKLPEPKADKKPAKSPSPETTSLAAEAHRHFSNGELDQAETNYVEVLARESNNAPALANLAAIQLERGRLDAALTNVRQALAASPDDAFTLSVLGRLKFRQAKYDEALDALSRAAKVDPKNAEVQIFLGLTLSEKGLRGPAEAALRKAIQLEPGNGNAHQNLAVIYLSQNPPAVELARWHYQRARASGAAANPELEKMLQERTAVKSAQ
jgi:tetratricopeptide (TPR) repeat protein